MMDNSNAFGEMTNFINDFFLTHRKQMGVYDSHHGWSFLHRNPLVFFEEQEVKLSEGMLYFGLSFDFVYLGLVQDWTD